MVLLLIVEKLDVELRDFTEVGEMYTRIERLGQTVFEIAYAPAQVFDRPQERQVVLIGQRVFHALLERAHPLIDGHLNERADFRRCIRFFRFGWCHRHWRWVGVGNALEGANLAPEFRVGWQIIVHEMILSCEPHDGALATAK